MTVKGRPVVVGLSGGLGNQLFQYAAGRALALRLGTSLSLDVSWYSGRAERHFGLAALNIAAKVLRPITAPADLVRLASRVSRRWAPRRYGVPFFRERQFHFDVAFDSLTQPVFLEGFWQSERYFLSQQAKIRAELTLAHSYPSTALPYLQRTGELESICVHVRRGDYVTNPAAAQTHGTCSPQYYREGVREIAASLAHPHGFVFSDDLAWARENLDLSIPTTFVDVGVGGAPQWDLALMASCRHFVIANSSLSWWAAWLGQHPDKQVIAPSPWFKDQTRDTRDLLPTTWRTLPAPT